MQTHISEVFLTRERVYKFRKAVDLGFVRFGSRDERNADCLREVTLNRRLAPDVYLGVAPLERGRGGVRVGAVTQELSDRSGELPEHCVVMRRLPGGRDALTLLGAERFTPALVDRLSRRIARFHDAVGLGTPAPFAPESWLEICTQPFRDSLALLSGTSGGALSRSEVEAVSARAEEFVRDHEIDFEARRRAGRAVDGHGDLHLQHAWFETDTSEPLVVDCLEFNSGLRRIDAAADVAFTAMDLAYRGREDLGERFLRVYARERDDYTLYSVVDYFSAYRAAVRAQVAHQAAADAPIDAAQQEAARESASRHLALSGAMLAKRGPGPLVLVAGTVGSGKTTLGEALAAAMPGVVVTSDRVRKRLAGLAPDARGGPSLYGVEARGRTYRALLERARAVLCSGRPVLLDATWARRADRAAAASLAREVGAPFRIVEATCAPEAARKRLAHRASIGEDASDAGPERLAPSIAGFESPVAAERAVWLRLPTDSADWRDRAAQLAATLASAAADPVMPQD